MLPPRPPRRIDAARPRLAGGARAARPPILQLLVLAVATFVLHACQGEPDALSPELRASKLPRLLTVTGGGKGGGVVTAPNYGETPSLNCVITNGTAGPEDCAQSYGWKTQVQLTATADPGGSTFTGWSGACSGTAPTCKVVMTQSRSVQASFAGQGTPTFTLNVSGDGDGNGTITSQAPLTPAINCTVTAGTAVSGACSGTYPEGDPGDARGRGGQWPHLRWLERQLRRHGHLRADDVRRPRRVGHVQRPGRHRGQHRAVGRRPSPRRSSGCTPASCSTARFSCGGTAASRSSGIRRAAGSRRRPTPPAPIPRPASCSAAATRS